MPTGTLSGQPRGSRPTSVAHDKGDAKTDLSSLDPELRSSLRILIVDDDHTLRESCSSILEMEGYDVTVSGRGGEAQDLLKRRRFDIALIDLYMTEVEGMDLLRTGLKTNPDMVAVMITGKPTVDSSVEALRAGAWDYLPKPFSATQLQVLIGRAAHAALGTRRTDKFQVDLNHEHGHSETITVLGMSPAFRKVIDVAHKVAATDASVLITGESGTGKELIAQYIHHHSRRASKPLVPLNCAALPETLLESEMFGHVKGSFTGAVRDKPGLLEVANGGTMFLDEITEMSQAIQAKLLRVIQDGAVRRIGSTKVDAVVNVRFMAATNRDPEQAVEAGDLRQDLYYRLRVVPIRVSALRERPEDIPILAKHFLVHYWKKHRERGAPLPSLKPTTIRALQSRPWPGNVRELQNAIEHAVVFLEPGADIEPDDIPSVDGYKQVQASVPYAFDVLDEPYHDARDRILAEFERRYLQWVVNRADGNMSKAARIAAIDRTTIYRLMEKHGVQRSTLLGGE
ncbi:MAG: response regulator [Gammaproteobacteria bacterium]|uniref:Sigma-54-dependent Fis family transcriptional regulator n=1 Tax=Candidatus Kutchimonas denitrificans TaxID=3056748 RepID=A0AAE5C960_9BACT|nr:sigma-54-dependent Fis family transcriptional regulator [Gemmatimonadota bacterium]NIR75151.1 sigma-54-dependent Fis family transcriptional regulator [Candidatus Kutchimonas denitrificans]NIU52961.1 response regulator [Gemmatimonadota bacterium]NIV52430.1 response regulator [Gammaproteobacteria bacterium]NIY44850.1 response regulator [Gemmatimonadota bacterium]